MKGLLNRNEIENEKISTYFRFDKKIKRKERNIFLVNNA